MEELADSSALGADDRKIMRVRVPLSAPLGNSSVFWKPKGGTREARPSTLQRRLPCARTTIPAARASEFFWRANIDLDTPSGVYSFYV